MGGRDFLISKALKFAKKAHDGQTRKYTSEPYILHPISVFAIGCDFYFIREQLAACLLHDVIEDTDVTRNDIASEFGECVSFLVWELTDIYTHKKYPNLNRRQRKSLEFDRLKCISPLAQNIKLADIIDNTRSIIPNNTLFAHTYLNEMKELMPMLTQGGIQLQAEAFRVLTEAENLITKENK